MKNYFVKIILNGKEFVSKVMPNNDEILLAINDKNGYNTIHVELGDGGLLVLGEQNIKDAIFIIYEKIILK